ncbi:hypothetical protein [Verrucomicrobium sp. BvORR034]|uniref:hypothetical protein n=1 Tax=Verrucomicrobium sp. BvORR034 TaxID=1396418 RepID=UPI000679C696|nr:hypothetical protein [Verrucomicrobium sp. BvORR034]
MKAIIIYVAVPFLVLWMIAICVKITWDLSPVLVLSTICGLFIIALSFGYFSRRRDLERGWRVGHKGRDQMYYEEMIRGRWERIPIDGEMLCGKARHVIYFPSRTQWETLPEWTRGRQSEIVARIKQAFAPPGYEYQEPQQADEDNLDKTKDRSPAHAKNEG